MKIIVKHKETEITIEESEVLKETSRYTSIRYIDENAQIRLLLSEIVSHVINIIKSE